MRKLRYWKKNKILNSMYYSYDEAGVPEITRFWDCDHVFSSEIFLCSCCKGRIFLFEWISTVVDRNLSLVKSVRHSCLKFSFLLIGKTGGLFVGAIYWIF